MDYDPPAKGGPHIPAVTASKPVSQPRKIPSLVPQFGNDKLEQITWISIGFKAAKSELL